MLISRYDTRLDLREFVTRFYAVFHQVAVVMWDDIARDKRARLAANIPSQWRIKTMPEGNSVISYPKQVMSEDELRITAMSAHQIVSAIAEKKYTAVQVTAAFLHQAALAIQLTNCALEFFPELALARARELDEYYEREGKVIGPLHGLPVSLKDQFRIKDLETCMGFVAWLGRYETSATESVMTRILRDAGAVFYIKTSVTQTLFSIHPCENPVVGRTLNPWDKRWGPGGSSGGESALIAMGGSRIGFGTDLGGSVRVPAAFTGLWALYTGHGRFPYAGLANVYIGWEYVNSTVGIIAHNAQDMRMMCQAVLESNPARLDPKVYSMPWRRSEEVLISEKIQNRGLTIAWFDDEEQATCQPPVQRAVRIVRDVLEKHGHVVVPIPTPLTTDFAAVVSNIYSNDAGEDIMRVIQSSGEPLIGIVAGKLGSKPAQTIYESSRWVEKRSQHQEFYLEQLRLTEDRLGREIDAIICPLHACAILTAEARRDIISGKYTTWVNNFQWTAVALPVTKVCREVDVRDEQYEPRSERDREIWDAYDANLFHGAPVGIQVVGRKLTEEKTLAIAEAIGEMLTGAEVQGEKI